MTDDNKRRQSGPKMHTDGGPGTDKDQEARRKAVAKIVAAGAVIAGSKTLPSQWARPIADAVVLPAHAQATGPGSAPGN